MHRPPCIRQSQKAQDVFRALGKQGLTEVLARDHHPSSLQDSSVCPNISKWLPGDQTRMPMFLGMGTSCSGTSTGLGPGPWN